MNETILIGIAAIFVLGIASMWLAWMLRVPSILLLLVVGFIAGPVTGLLDPNSLLGDGILPIVSLSVALILFEGGLSLRLVEFRDTGRVVTTLVTLGAAVTLGLSTLAAHVFLSLDWGMAMLLGAVTVVSGPTVVGPLLRHIRPKVRVASILKWESIVIDPIGALLAVLVFEVIIAAEGGFSYAHTAQTVFLTVSIGVALGTVSAALLTLAWTFHRIPDHLVAPVALMVVLLTYVLSNHLQGESGLFTVTVMGMVLANQRWMTIKNLIEFKENLRTILISMLFIILAARLEMSAFQEMGIGAGLLIAALVFVIRPLTVAICTAGSKLSWQERVFLASVYPRGIVAAAVASIFSLELVQAGFTEAERLVPLTFMVILATVGLHGLAAPMIARILGVAVPNPQGCLILGAHDWAREVAVALKRLGFRTLLIDTNRANTRAARLLGLRAYHGSALAEGVIDELDLDGLGRLLALTPNDEANSLASLRFTEVFGHRNVYQLSPESAGMATGKGDSDKALRGHYLFADWMTHSTIGDRFSAGAVIKATPITEEFGIEEFQEHWGDRATPIFIVSDYVKLRILTVGTPPKPQPGDILISLVLPKAKDQ